MIRKLCFLLLLINAQCNAAVTIPTRHIDKLNIEVSFLGLGTVEIGRDWGMDTLNSKHPDDNTAAAVLLQALQSGMNIIDTASSYGLSEERIGRFIPASKNRYLLITKPGEHNVLASDPICKAPSKESVYCKTPAAIYDFSPEAIRRDIRESLKKLKVKTIDVALLHLDSKTAAQVIEERKAIKTLNDLRKEGKIHYIGVSINGPVAIKAVKQLPIDFIELEYNLLNQTNSAAIDIASKKGIGVIIRGGLGTGLLTKYAKHHIDDPKLPYGQKVRALLQLTGGNYDKLTQLALAFLYEDKRISTVIVGADRAQYIRQDIAWLTQFNDTNLLAKAKKLMQRFQTPTEFTEIMGEYYQ